MKKLVLMAALMLIGFTVSAQKVDDAYKEKVTQLIKMQSGQGAAAIDQILDKTSEAVPQGKQEAFKKEMKAEMEKLYDKMTDVYLDVYDKEEIDAMIKFYNSPIGQRIQKKMPKVTAKTMEMSQEFSAQLMPIIRKYMN